LDPGANGRGKKTVFLSHLYIKMLILPRQARDKHREKHSKRDRFRAGVTIRAAPGKFVGSCMFHASNGTTTTSMFGSRLTDMLLDATHLRPTGGMIPAVVRADAWQGMSPLLQTASRLWFVRW
jgi:hypothetical protein